MNLNQEKVNNKSVYLFWMSRIYINDIPMMPCSPIYFTKLLLYTWRLAFKNFFWILCLIRIWLCRRSWWLRLSWCRNRIWSLWTWWWSMMTIPLKQPIFFAIPPFFRLMLIKSPFATKKLIYFTKMIYTNLDREEMRFWWR